MAKNTHRKLAAILAADVVGYSRLMGEDEAGTLDALRAHREELIEPKIAEHEGRVVKLMGDGLLAEFPSAVEAVQCAIEIQHTMGERNADIPEDRRLTYRIGINVGDIIVEGDDIYGDGVNVAARLEGLAEPGGICIRRNVRNQVRDKLDIDFEDLGEVEVKNIARPVRVFRVVLDDKAAALVTPVVQLSAKQGPRPRLVAAAGMAVLLFAAAGVFWWQPWEPDVEPASIGPMAFPLPDKPSIAVLPFDNLSGDERYERFVDGITEDMISDLARYRDLFVIARNSTSVYKGKAVDVRRVARDLGVKYVMEGSIQIASDRVRITVQVIDASTGRHIWVEKYDRPLDDIFAVQDEVVQKVSAAITGYQGALADAEREVARRKPPESLEAYELYLIGFENKHKFTAEGNREAKRDFLRALELDPGLARAYVGLSWVSLNDAAWGWTDSPGDSLNNHFESAQKAVDLDDADPEAHAVLGYAFAYVKSNFERSAAEFDRALNLGPNHADTLANIGWGVGEFFGKGPEGLDLITRAIRLNPNYPDWYENALETAAYYARDFKQSIAAFRRAGSQTAETRLYAALSYAQLGDEENAAKQLKELLTLDPEFTARKWLDLTPHPDRGAEALFLDGARKAGLPEG